MEDRGKFYEEAGAIRDVLQNHLLQVLGSVTMDPHTGRDHDAIRDEKARLFKAVGPLRPGDVVRGQYEATARRPACRRARRWRPTPL